MNRSVAAGSVNAFSDSGEHFPRCSGSVTALSSLLVKRAAARAAVRRVCDADIKRICAGIQQGDGNLMECFL